MTVALIILCAVLGLAIGSFLNVVIWRVPRGESVARPPSHCPGCDQPIRNRDNVPVVSWLLLQGKCRDCGVPISARYPLVELLTGGLFVLAAVRVGWHADLLAYLYLAALAVALALIDLDVKRLPDVLTLPSYPVALGLLGATALVQHDGHGYLRALIGMAAFFLFYAVLWFIYPAGMGLGDVKLAGILGLYLGWVGWGAWAVGIFAGFFLGGFTSIGLLLAGKAGRKSKIPFGPFMLLGALVGLVAGTGLAAAYLSATVG